MDTASSMAVACMDDTEWGRPSKLKVAGEKLSPLTATLGKGYPREGTQKMRSAAQRQPQLR